MLDYFALIFIVFLSIKLSLQLANHKQAFQAHGISQARRLALQLAPLLYILSLAGLAVPVSWLDLFGPIPVGFLLVLPGILLGRKISGSLGRVGIDTAAEAGRAAGNVMWLGAGVAIFMAANIVLGLVFRNVHAGAFG